MIESTEAAPGLAHASTGSSERRGLARRLPLVAGVIGVYGLLAVTLVFVMPGLFGFRTYSGVGDSMGDAIPNGSLILTRSVAAEEVAVGDVIAFRWPGFPHAITHRVVDVRSRGGTPLFVTKGDGNAARDPFLASGDQEIRRVLFSVPHLGTFLPVVKSLVYVLAFAGGFILWRRARRRRLAAAHAAPGSPSSG